MSWLLMPFRVFCSGFCCLERFFKTVLLLLSPLKSYCFASAEFAAASGEVVLSAVHWHYAPLLQYPGMSAPAAAMLDNNYRHYIVPADCFVYIGLQQSESCPPPTELSSTSNHA